VPGRKGDNTNTLAGTRSWSLGWNGGQKKKKERKFDYGEKKRGKGGVELLLADDVIPQTQQPESDKKKRKKEKKVSGTVAYLTLPQDYSGAERRQVEKGGKEGVNE